MLKEMCDVTEITLYTSKGGVMLAWKGHMSIFHTFGELSSERVEQCQTVVKVLIFTNFKTFEL